MAKDRRLRGGIELIYFCTGEGSRGSGRDGLTGEGGQAVGEAEG